jgi:ASC-1-like (ASCH) protein
LGKKPRGFTKLFKETPIKISFRTRNTIQNILKPYSQMYKYEKSTLRGAAILQLLFRFCNHRLSRVECHQLPLD